MGDTKPGPQVLEGPSRKRINVKRIWSGMGKRQGKFSPNSDSVFTKVVNTGRVSPV